MPNNYYLSIQILRPSAIPAKDRGWAIFKVVSNFTKQAACLLKQICSFFDCVFILISQQGRQNLSVIWLIDFYIKILLM